MVGREGDANVGGIIKDRDGAGMEMKGLRESERERERERKRETDRESER